MLTRRFALVASASAASFVALPASAQRQGPVRGARGKRHEPTPTGSPATHAARPGRYGRQIRAHRGLQHWRDIAREGRGRADAAVLDDQVDDRLYRL